jgi:hypothetical protein
MTLLVQVKAEAVVSNSKTFRSPLMQYLAKRGEDDNAPSSVGIASAAIDAKERIRKRLRICQAQEDSEDTCTFFPP